MLSRHSGMFLAGIHPYERPNTWIPAKTFAGMTDTDVNCF
jgi:hypothetical protein